MYILDEFSDGWNYTFIIVAVIAIGIGTFFALRSMKDHKLKSRREKRNGNLNK